MAQDINKVVVSSEMSEKDYFFVSTGGKLRRIPRSVIEALGDKVWLRLDGSKPVTGPIAMVGNKITGLGDAEDDGDALALAFAKTLFAPSKFGLGEYTPNVVDSLRDAQKSGFYASNGDTPTGNGDWWNCIVSSRDGSVFSQLAFRTYGTRMDVCFRKHNNGYQPWEWLNPPMHIAEEYQTIERHSGKPVFTILSNLGYGPNNTTKNTQIGVSAGDIVRVAGRIAATASSGSRGTVQSLPYSNESETVELSAYIANNTTDLYASVKTNFDASTRVIWCQVWYTKP